ATGAHGEAVFTATAGLRRCASGRCAARCTRRRSALRGPHPLRGRPAHRWRERTAVGAVARSIYAARITGAARSRGSVSRQRRDYSLHGNSRRALSPYAIPGYRRARPTLECPRTERVPAPRLRAAPDGVPGGGTGGFRRAAALNRRQGTYGEAGAIFVRLRHPYSLALLSAYLEANPDPCPPRLAASVALSRVSSQSFYLSGGNLRATGLVLTIAVLRRA